VKKNCTAEYYDSNAEQLITRYDNTNVEQLHTLFSKYIKTGDKVLDIGFGSGRDLKEIMKITPNVFGLDACEKFIENTEQNNFLKGRVAKSILPNIVTDKFQVSIAEFDVIVSIAVLMHLNMKEIEQSIENIKSILTKNGVFIISYSTKRDCIDDRHFEPLSREIMINIFAKHGFTEIEYIQNNDGMNRDIEWVTQIYSLTESSISKLV